MILKLRRTSNILSLTQIEPKTRNTEQNNCSKQCVFVDIAYLLLFFIENLKSKYKKTFIRPIQCFGCETWVLKKESSKNKPGVSQNCCINSMDASRIMEHVIVWKRPKLEVDIDTTFKRTVSLQQISITSSATIPSFSQVQFLTESYYCSLTCHKVKTVT